MVMDTLQIRMNAQLVGRIDFLVKKGVYSSRSDAIREAVRDYFWHRQIGQLHSKNNSVQEIRKARRTLSRQKLNLDEINNFQ